MTTEFTQAQKEILQKALDLIGEHFDCALLVVSTECEDCASEISEVYWRGGFFKAVGAAEMAKHKILASSTRADKLPGEDWRDQ